MLPPLIRKLFSNNGFGDKLRQEIIPNLDASILKTGKINPNLIPDLAYNILYRVDNIGQMYVLTVNEVQNYDFVLVDEDRLYMVVDDTKLTSDEGYLFLLSLKNFNGGIPASSSSAERLAKAITVEITGAIEAKQENWDGSSNITLNVSKFEPSACSVLYPIKYIEIEDEKEEVVVLEDSGTDSGDSEGTDAGETIAIETKEKKYNIVEDDLNKILCINTPGVTLVVKKIEVNGWNCIVKNLTDKTSSIVTESNDIYLEREHEVILAPDCSIQLISNHDNYIVIDNTPKIVLE